MVGRATTQERASGAAVALLSADHSGEAGMLEPRVRARREPASTATTRAWTSTRALLRIFVPWLVHRRRDAIKHPAVALDDGVRGLGPGKRGWFLVPTPHVGREVFA